MRQTIKQQAPDKTLAASGNPISFYDGFYAPPAWNPGKNSKRALELFRLMTLADLTLSALDDECPADHVPWNVWIRIKENIKQSLEDAQEVVGHVTMAEIQQKWFAPVESSQTTPEDGEQ